MDTQTILNAPDKEEIQREHSSVIEGALKVHISNVAQHEVALLILRDLKGAEKKVRDRLDPIVDAAHKAHKGLTKLRSDLLGPIQEAYGVVSGKATQYEIEQERIRQERQRKLEEAARKAEEERQLREAIEAEAAGDRTGATEILDQPVETPMIQVEAAVAKVDGISAASDRFSGEVVDFMALIRYVAQNPDEISLLDANTTTLNARARSMRDGFKLPGCKLVKTRVRAVRSAE